MEQRQVMEAESSSWQKTEPWSLILDDNEGKNPGSLDAGHMPHSTWGLYSAFFGDFGLLDTLANCLDQMCM